MIKPIFALIALLRLLTKAIYGDQGHRSCCGT